MGWSKQTILVDWPRTNCRAVDLVTGLHTGDQGLSELARAQLDAFKFLLQSTAASLAQKNSDDSVVGGKIVQPTQGIGRRESARQVTSGERARLEHLQGAPNIICTCARLGLWAEAKDVYECSARKLGGSNRALLQRDILALMHGK